MRLSKQERIGVLIILVVVIIAVGVFVFIVPAAQEIETTLKNLDNKQAEYESVLAKAALRGPLKTQILDEYEEGEHIADMFFPEMKSYEAENAAREIILQSKANIVVTEMTVANPGTATLNTNFPTEREVSYSLKTNATQGAEPDEATAKRLMRLALLQNALGGNQTIGASTVSFTVKAASQEELTKFVDEINNYFKDENGVSTRKAVMITSEYAIIYDDVEKKYDEYVDELNELAEEAGQAAIDAGLDGEFTFEIPDRNTEGDGDDDDEEIDISTTYRVLDVTLTFYSIERMQDPGPQLDAQDGIVSDTDSDAA
ncbi:MAG: hypothetical protein J1F04_02475 [Oscillospiraceae bacterium]|nr:hypothetical protein [Oscillospiraceae bacterium]